MFTIYSLYVHHMFTICSLYVHYMVGHVALFLLHTVYFELMLNIWYLLLAKIYFVVCHASLDGFIILILNGLHILSVSKMRLLTQNPCLLGGLSKETSLMLIRYDYMNGVIISNFNPALMNTF